MLGDMHIGEDGLEELEVESSYDELEYAAWLLEVSSIIESALGVDLADLPDWESLDYFCMGTPPGEAAIEAICNAGIPEWVDPYDILGIEEDHSAKTRWA